MIALLFFTWIAAAGKVDGDGVACTSSKGACTSPHDESLVRLDESFVSVDENLVRLDESFVSVDESLVRLDESFVSVDENLVSVDESLVSVDESLVSGVDPVTWTPEDQGGPRCQGHTNRIRKSSRRSSSSW